MSSIEPVKALYAAFATGDMPAALATMAPDIVWNEAENYPYADRNPYVWPEAVLMNLLDDSLSADLSRDGRLTEAMTLMGQFCASSRKT